MAGCAGRSVRGERRWLWGDRVGAPRPRGPPQNVAELGTSPIKENTLFDEKFIFAVVANVCISFVLYLWCWLVCIKQESFSGFWQNRKRWLSFRIPPHKEEPVGTTKDGEWANESWRVHNYCGICGYWHSWAIRHNPNLAQKILEMCKNDDSLPPAVRKGQVCLSCLVSVTGGRYARKHYLTVQKIWPKTDWSWKRRLLRWLREVRYIVFPFSNDWRSGFGHLWTEPQYKWPRFLFILLCLQAFGSILLGLIPEFAFDIWKFLRCSL